MLGMKSEKNQLVKWKKNHKSDEHTWYKNQIKPND
jgi:hypothetical protein